MSERLITVIQSGSEASMEYLRKPLNEADHVMITVFLGFMNSHVVSCIAKVRN